MAEAPNEKKWKRNVWFPVTSSVDAQRFYAYDSSIGCWTMLDCLDRLAVSGKVLAEEFMPTNKPAMVPFSHMLDLIRSLETRLFDASQRIGFLEAQLDKAQQGLRERDELKHQLNEAERERQELHLRIIALEVELLKRSQ